MSDEGTPPEGEQATVLVDAEGKLVDNWQTHAPEGYEGLREDKSLGTLKSLWDMGKSYVHVRKQVPLDKTAIPNDNWGDDEWNEWHKAGGRPETAADYAMARDENIPEELMPKEMIDGYQELFHKIGLSKKQSDAINEYNTGQMLAEISTAQQQHEDDVTKVSDGLRKLWGLAYDQNVHRGNVAIDKDKDVEGDPEYKARLLEKVNADPDLIRFASNMGYKFVEHKIVEDPGIPTPEDVQQRINAEMLKPEYLQRDHPNHEHQVQLVQRLFEEKRKHG